MRIRRIVSFCVVFGIIFAVLVGGSLLSFARDIVITSPEIDYGNFVRVNDSFDGTLMRTVVRLNSVIGPQYNFYPSVVNGRVSVYGQEDPSYGSVLYSVTNQFTVTPVYIQTPELFYDMAYFAVRVRFGVFADNEFRAGDDAYETALWRSLTSGGQQIKINGTPLQVEVVDLTLGRDASVPNGYTCEVWLEPTEPEYDRIFSLFDPNGKADVFFQLTSLPTSVYYGDNILTMGNFESNVVIEYYLNSSEEDRPLSPSQTEKLDDVSQVGDHMSDVGNDLAGAASDLEAMTPSVGDPFANAPRPDGYRDGSHFFKSFFDYLYVNEIVGAFISFSLIMALVVFIMRR